MTLMLLPVVAFVDANDKSRVDRVADHDHFALIGQALHAIELDVADVVGHRRWVVRQIDVGRHHALHLCRTSSEQSLNLELTIENVLELNFYCGHRICTAACVAKTTG